MRRRTFLGGLAAGIAVLPQSSRAAGDAARFRPEDHGAAGDGRTDDTAALAACLAAALAAQRAGRPAEIVVSRTHLVTDTLLVRQLPAPLAIRGAGAAAGFIAGGGGRMTCLHVRAGGARGEPVAIVSPAQAGSRVIEVADAGGLQAADILLVTNATGYRQDRRQGLVVAAAVQGRAVTLAGGLPFAIDPQLPARLQAQTMTAGLTVENLSFRRGSATGEASGLRVEYCRSPRISGIRSDGFNGHLSSGQAYGPCLGGRYVDLADRGSGSRPEIDSIKFWGVSEAEIADVTSRESGGFGIGISFVSGSRLDRLTVEGANGRGLKLFGSCANRLSGLRVVGSDKTGLSISGGSSFNRFTGVEAIGNRESGVWLNGTANNNNRFERVVSRDNGVDLMVAATAPLVDRGNTFSGVSGLRRTSIAPSTGTVIGR